MSSYSTSWWSLLFINRSSLIGKCWPISREWNVIETPRAIVRTSFKVKGHRSRSPAVSRDASDTCWPIVRERNVLVEAPKLVGRLSTPWKIMRTSFKVKRQRSRSLSRLMLGPEVRHVFQTVRPINFKIATPMEHAINCHGHIKAYKVGYCYITQLPHNLLCDLIWPCDLDLWPWRSRCFGDAGLHAASVYLVWSS